MNTLDMLTRAYNAWLTQQKLPQTCARELLAEVEEDMCYKFPTDKFTDQQREFLKSFVKLWDELELKATGITSEMLHVEPATYVLKRTEYIEVEAKDPDDALDRFQNENGGGEHVHEVEEIYLKSDGPSE